MKQVSFSKKTTAAINVSKNKVEVPEVKTSSPKAETPKLETPEVKTTHSKAEATLQKIQEKAYELFLKRNGAPGSPEEDWIQAEKIVKGK